MTMELEGGRLPDPNEGKPLAAFERAASGLRESSLERLARMARLSHELERLRAGDRPVPLPMMRRAVFGAYRDAIDAGVGIEATALLPQGFGLPQPQISRERHEVKEGAAEAAHLKKEEDTPRPASLSFESSSGRRDTDTSLCISCKFYAEIDDRTLISKNTGRYICVGCHARHTETQLHMPKSLERELRDTVDAIQ